MSWGFRWLGCWWGFTFAELAAGLLHRDDSGHRLGGGTGRDAAGVLRRVMRASTGPSA